MGCCLSTVDRHPDTDTKCGVPPMSPPPVLELEETVKEVLLETPIIVPKVDGRIKGLMPPENQEWKVEVGPPPAAVIHGDLDPQEKVDDEEIVSEISEICSYSEGFSNATASYDDKLDHGDEDSVVNQRPPVRTRRGPAGGRGRGVGRGRSEKRVIVRRAAAPSPEKKGHMAPLRTARGRPLAGQPRNVAGENIRRGEPGKDSRRRSRSPVRRDDVVARRNASDERTAAAGRGDPPNDVVPAEVAESFENPVVSLECFIFL